MRETRAQSRMCTRVSHGRGAAATVCAGWECWRWYGGGSQWAHSLPGLSVLFPCLSYSISLPFSLFLYLSFSLSPSPSLYSVHSSPHPSSPVPPNSPPFLYLPLTHLICPCSLPLASLFTSLSRSFCLQNPCWRGPSFSSRRDPNSVSVAVIPENRALVLSLPLCPLPSPSSRNATIVFLILED